MARTDLARIQRIVRMGIEVEREVAQWPVIDLVNGVMKESLPELITHLEAMLTDTSYSYKWAIYPGRPTAYTECTASPTDTNITLTSNAGLPFAEVGVGDVVKLYWTDSNGGHEHTGLVVGSIGSSGITLVLTTADWLECVNNGNFAEDNHWVYGVGWTYTTDEATATGAISTNLKQLHADQTVPLVAGATYTVSYMMTQSAGTIQCMLGTGAGSVQSASGAVTEDIVAGGTTLDLEFVADGFTGTIGPVSVIPTFPLANTTVRVELEEVPV